MKVLGYDGTGFSNQKVIVEMNRTELANILGKSDYIDVQPSNLVGKEIYVSKIFNRLVRLEQSRGQITKAAEYLKSLSGIMLEGIEPVLNLIEEAAKEEER